VNCEWREEKVVIEVSEGEVSVTTSQRHNSTKLEAEISSVYIVPETET
jgi:hypothetical protein